MIALELQDTKDFMNKLLLSPAFDHFCVVEATIVTYQTVAIDGKTNKSYYDDEDPEGQLPYNTWAKIKPFCVQLIKGRRTPLSFRITLTLSPDNIANVLHSIHSDLSPQQVQGLLLNLKYDGTKTTCITGISLSTFTLDKSLEQEWDALAVKFFKKNQIVSTQL